MDPLPPQAPPGRSVPDVCAPCRRWQLASLRTLDVSLLLEAKRVSLVEVMPDKPQSRF